MKVQGLILLVCAVVAPISAFADFWVSIASFKNRDGAETAMVDAKQRSGTPVQIHGASTEKGYFFRVASGPYATRSQAQQAQATLRATGFGGGWIWQSTTSVPETLQSYRDIYSNKAVDVDAQSSDAYWNDNFQLTPDSDLDAEDPLQSDTTISDDVSAPQVPSAAPANYKLNKLRRDARAPPLRPSSQFPALSRSSEPSATPTPQNSSTQAVSDPASQPLPNSITAEQTAAMTLAAGAASGAGSGDAPSPDAPNVEFALESPIVLARRDQVPEDLQIDGRLDEGIWRSLPGADGFSVIDPDTLAKPPYRTLVKGFYTSRGLYVGIDMEQPTDTLVRRLSSRDSRQINRDNVGVTLDTSGSGRYGYWMNVALGGSQSDGTVLPERQFSSDWDGAWYSGTAVTQTGWSAEFFLPWSQMAMPKTGDDRIIKVYIMRKVAALDERWSIPALPSTSPLFMSKLQPLQLSKVAPIQQWSVFPYLSTTFDALEHQDEENVGVDLFWRPSTNFQVTAALKPDFGGVESDDVVVNLGAFETFFPEKRLFFQEGIEVFTATPRAEESTPTTLLNTRRIGGVGRAPDLPDSVTLSDMERQQPVELAGALKAVGSFGAFRYGLLSATEEDVTYRAGDQRFSQSGTDYGVARLLYEGKGASGDYRALGVLSALTSHSEQDTQAYGVDYHYLTAKGQWKIDGQLLFSSADQRKDGFGGFADVRRDFGHGRSLHLGYVHYDEELNINDLGFLQRNDLRGGNGRYRVTRSDGAYFRKTSMAYWFRLERNAAGDYVRKGIGIDAELDLRNRHRLKLGGGFFPARYEDLDSRGNGTYRFGDRHRLEVSYATDSALPVSGQIETRRQTEKYGGAEWKTSLAVRWRVLDNLALNAKVQFVDRSGWLLWREGINFAAFDADEWQPEVGLEYFPSAKHQLKLSAQWIGIRAKQSQNYQLQRNGKYLQAVANDVMRSPDFAISDLSLQLRYRWEIAPLSDLFVVYTLNGRYEVEEEAFDELLSSTLSDPIAEQITVKLRYRFGS